MSAAHLARPSPTQQSQHAPAATPYESPARRPAAAAAPAAPPAPAAAAAAAAAATALSAQSTCHYRPLSSTALTRPLEPGPASWHPQPGRPRALPLPLLPFVATHGRSPRPSWKRLDAWQIEFLEHCFGRGEVGGGPGAQGAPGSAARGQAQAGEARKWGKKKRKK